MLICWQGQKFWKSLLEASSSGCNCTVQAASVAAKKTIATATEAAAVTATAAVATLETASHCFDPVSEGGQTGGWSTRRASLSENESKLAFHHFDL